MRVLLDVHSMIRCGPEPVVGEFLFQFRLSLDRFKDRLTEINIYPDILDTATANFLAEIIEQMGEPAPYLCHKDPRTFFYLSYLGYLFPNAKFVNMLRDGRGAIMSSKRRQLSNGTEFLLLAKWERFVRQMQYDCQTLGPTRCLTVRYEQLVLYPEKTLHKVMEFLGVPWDPKVLEHEKWVENVTSLTTFDKSSDQVKQKIYEESLSTWAEPDSILTEDFIQNAHQKCTFLEELGYDIVGIPPNYRLLSWDQPHLDWIPEKGDLDPPIPGKKLTVKKYD
ncbi:Protein-tyrosine sulfotransferase [Paragonimus heterotremus]|uniref:Protein-tyrosine sulfotransferase n=1 Tax=Paragonimus heterotremus TaxID=100268 RepID=A0A8J4WKS7_9TREM|nr:Protein-tyrosine sulfotransferase [Paragonimus heterotremus]